MSEQNLFTASELKAHLEKDHCKSFNCFHLNTRSARNKTVELGLLFDEFNFLFDVIMFTETWYSNESDVFSLPDYNGYYLNRTIGRGGCIINTEK